MDFTSRMTRPDGRQNDQLRPISFIPNVAPHATGSVLVSFGDTRVICAATIEEDVPRWMRAQRVDGGWLTAEYSMLPYSTLERKPRDISRGKIDGRSSEIQRLIGRALRAVVDLKKIGQRTVWIDCDVLQADGGTRTASITGGWVALAFAVRNLERKGLLERNPIRGAVAAVSAGVVDGVECLDLCYEEDSKAEVDMNFVMTDQGRFVEIQGTAEAAPFSKTQSDRMAALAWSGIRQLIQLQRAAIRRA